MKQFALFALVVAVVCGCGKKNVTAPLGADENAQGCAAVMDRLDHAKGLWAQQLNRAPGDTPTLDDLAPYLRHTPGCPGGGTLTLNKVSDKVTCSIPEHNTAYDARIKEQGQAAPPQ